MAESAKPPCSPHPASSCPAGIRRVGGPCRRCSRRLRAPRHAARCGKARRNPGDEAIETVHAWLDVRLPSSHDLDRRPRVRCHRAVPGVSEQGVGERASRAPPARNRILWDVELEAGAGCGRVGLRRHRRRNRLPARAQSSSGGRLLDAKKGDGHGPEPAEDLTGEHLAGGHAVPSRDHDGLRGAAVAARAARSHDRGRAPITPVDRPQRDAHLDGPRS